MFGLGETELVVIVVVGGLALGLYFLPTIVAWQRDHENTVAILLLNLFLGWMLIPWVGALVWSAIAQRPRSRPGVSRPLTDGPG